MNNIKHCPNKATLPIMVKCSGFNQKVVLKIEKQKIKEANMRPMNLL